jgi:hypothetical protein
MDGAGRGPLLLALMLFVVALVIALRWLRLRQRAVVAV